MRHPNTSQTTGAISLCVRTPIFHYTGFDAPSSDCLICRSRLACYSFKRAPSASSSVYHERTMFPAFDWEQRSWSTCSRLVLSSSQLSSLSSKLYPRFIPFRQAFGLASKQAWSFCLLSNTQQDVSRTRIRGRGCWCGWLVCVSPTMLCPVHCVILTFLSFLWNHRSIGYSTILYRDSPTTRHSEPHHKFSVGNATLTYL